MIHFVRCKKKKKKMGKNAHHNFHKVTSSNVLSDVQVTVIYDFKKSRKSSHASSWNQRCFCTFKPFIK